MRFPKAILCVTLVLGLVPVAAAQENKPLREPDVIFVPTPQAVVDAMLKMAGVHKGDVVYDLGSGDGRIVVTAAKEYGVKGIGIDINPQRIAEANANAAQAGVTSLVTFRNEDLFEADIHEASVVTLYLLTSLNLKLRPKLWHDLKPGTRVVSQTFDMGDWKPEKEDEIEGHTIYLWRIPENAAEKKSLLRLFGGAPASL
ncbi:MAG: methyltransferase domain-containing protein [Bryobacteraceae bacterium]|jgi:SAM-dependent methyltransferase